MLLQLPAAVQWECSESCDRANGWFKLLILQSLHILSKLTTRQEAKKHVHLKYWHLFNIWRQPGLTVLHKWAQWFWDTIYTSFKFLPFLDHCPLQMLFPDFVRYTITKTSAFWEADQSLWRKKVNREIKLTRKDSKNASHSSCADTSLTCGN